MFEIIDLKELVRRLEGYSHNELHIHHTYRPNHEIYFNNPNGIYWQEAMQRYHMETLGWSDIAQHVTLLPEGTFVTGRDFSRNPASIRGYNGRVFMVEMIGDFDIGNDPFDGPQKQSALQLARWFDQQGRYIRFHNENSSKTCPGSSIDKYDFMKEVRSEAIYYMPTLREGSRGEEVRHLQENLNQLGYSAGSVDGIFGSLTKAAVTAFQRVHGLVPDGIYGTKTREKLEEVLHKKEMDEKEDEKEVCDLEELQLQLDSIDQKISEIIVEVNDIKTKMLKLQNEK